MNQLTVKVILDSNFLFVPLQFRIDIFDEIEKVVGEKVELTVLSTTLNELERLVRKGKNKVSRQAAFALEIARKCKVLNVKKLSTESNDDVIARTAKELRCPVATNDRMLKRRLRNMGVAVIYVREKSHLEMEGTV